jgi:hypothetical protein
MAKYTSSRAPMLSKDRQLPVLLFWIETPMGGPDGAYLIPSSISRVARAKKRDALGVRLNDLPKGWEPMRLITMTLRAI